MGILLLHLVLNFLSQEQSKGSGGFGLSTETLMVVKRVTGNPFPANASAISDSFLTFLMV